MDRHLGIDRVVSEAFSLGWERGFIFVRLFWAPLLLAVGVSTAVGLVLAQIFAVLFATGFDPNGSNGPLLFWGLTGLNLVVLVFTTFLFGAAVAAFYRFVVTGETPKGLVHVNFAGPSVRTAIAQLGFGLLFYLSMLGPISLAVFLATRPEIGPWGQEIRHFETFRLSDEAVATLQTGYGVGLLVSLILGAILTPLAPMAAVENRLHPIRAAALSLPRLHSIFTAYVLFILCAAALYFVLGLGLGILEVGFIAFESLIGAPRAGFIPFLTIGYTLLVIAAFSVAAAQAALPALIYKRLVEIREAGEEEAGPPGLTGPAGDAG
ncbi:MAG: hypothetical protein AAFR11_03645 [Pseudomonadota bacterium]